MQANQIVEGTTTELDYQQNFIKQLFYGHKDRILQAPMPIKEATEVMYEVIEERINILTSKTRFTCRFLILVGGICINGYPHMGSFCSFKRVEVVDLETGNTNNILDYIE